ncbi:hypothetical protein D3C85_1594450 [compost metagenome]
MALAVRRIDYVAGGLHQTLVVRILEVAVDQHDAAAIGLVFVQVVENIGQRFFGVMVRQFKHQSRIVHLTECHAERTEHVFPILAPITGVKH